MKQGSFWSACEMLVGPAAVELDWKQLAGEEYEAAKAFLRPMQELATRYPCLTLSHSERYLLQLMQEIHYGRIEGLAIRDGEPVIEPSTKVLRDVKLDLQAKRNPIFTDRDYRDKAQVMEMLHQFRRLGDGVVQTLEVHNGLPFRMQIVETVRT